ncbi:sensor histidine kinase [Catenovulum sp. SX2]|uniref:sensor histidine kinase n=1 Tax=Catenovulum sp. SX2 TaxID=3398614 RepID=UPI003F852943
MSLFNSAFRHHFAFWLAFAGAILVCVYICFKFVYLHINIAESHADLLSEFSRRTVARMQANPQVYQDNSQVSLGNRKMQLVADYAKLQKVLPYVPADPTQLINNKINLVFDSFNGLFSVANFAIVYPIPINQGDGQGSYWTFFRFAPELNDELIEIHLRQSLQPVIFTSAIIITLLFLAQVTYTYKMDSNLAKLADWAQGLSLAKANVTPPKLAERGLTPLATTVSKSLMAFNQVLEKEQSFAKFSSHELRTQVAILSANMEILDAIMADLEPNERKVLYRMEQVVSDMKYQTEALLWISKETEQELEYTDCDLLVMLEKAQIDNQYLLEKKPVTLQLFGEKRIVQSHTTLLQIVLNNLLRNAAQNTFNGEIVAEVTPSSVIVTNQDIDDIDGKNNPDGFGIGLVIVEKIAKRLNIQYLVTPLTNGRRVELIIP